MNQEIVGLIILIVAVVLIVLYYAKQKFDYPELDLTCWGWKKGDPWNRKW